MKQDATERHSLILPARLHMVAWEITRRCNLACLHCRAASNFGPYEGEFSTGRCLGLIDEIAEVGKPVVILTGGEPYLREDIFRIAAYGNEKGLRMVLATNGTTVDDSIAEKTREAGIKRVSISIDGANAPGHDAFRGVPGAFEGACAGIEAFKRAGVEFQINTTVTDRNIEEIDRITAFAEDIGAAGHHIFLLVPTGRGKDLAGQAIGAADYERTLNWFYEKSLCSPLQLKATCAPQYYRIFRQRSPGTGKRDARSSPLHSMTRGCMGGSSFCFISHVGQVQPCGFLEIDCGRLTERSFSDIWHNSKIFADLRNLAGYKGKCGRCEFLKICGGCRARAWEASGDYLAEEPLCAYEPKKKAGAESSAC